MDIEADIRLSEEQGVGCQKNRIPGLVMGFENPLQILNLMHETLNK